MGGLPPGPRCDPHPHSPASLGPSSCAHGPSQESELAPASQGGRWGAFTHTKAGVLWASAPPPSREIAAQAAGVRSNRAWRPGGPDVETPAPPTACHRASGREARATFDHGPKPRWGSEADWFWAKQFKARGRVLGLPAAREAPGWCLEAGTPGPHVWARLALLVQMARARRDRPLSSLSPKCLQRTVHMPKKPGDRGYFNSRS